MWLVECVCFLLLSMPSWTQSNVSFYACNKHTMQKKVRVDLLLTDVGSVRSQNNNRKEKRGYNRFGQEKTEQQCSAVNGFGRECDLQDFSERVGGCTTWERERESLVLQLVYCLGGKPEKPCG